MPLRSPRSISVTTASVLLIGLAACAWSAWPARHDAVPDWRSLYLSLLGGAFVFWNSVRIFTYVPTIRLLLRRGSCADHHSLLTWGSWVLSNGTMALYLFETGGRRIDSLVLLNSGNTLMCLLTCALIVRLRRRGH